MFGRFYVNYLLNELIYRNLNLREILQRTRSNPLGGMFALTYTLQGYTFIFTQTPHPRPAPHFFMDTISSAPDPVYCCLFGFADFAYCNPHPSVRLYKDDTKLHNQATPDKDDTPPRTAIPDAYFKVWRPCLSITIYDVYTPQAVGLRGYTDNHIV